METMSLGVIALTVVSASACCSYYKKYIWAIVCALSGAILTVLTGACWEKMLSESGKNTAWLGFQQYPAVLPVLSVLLIASFALVIVNITGAVIQHLRKE